MNHTLLHKKSSNSNKWHYFDLNACLTQKYVRYHIYDDSLEEALADDSLVAELIGNDKFTGKVWHRKDSIQN